MMTFNIKKSIAVVFLCCGIGAVTTGCEDMFETDSNRQIFDPALDQKTDSMFYTLGILKGLQLAADQYVMTGEMRGDLVATNQYTETDLRRLADFSADVTNKYDSAYVYYRIINNCNYYIAHRDTTLRTGSRQVAIPEYAEALAIRAWAYMQLAKNYGTVPFYTDPLVSIDDANSLKESKDLQGICDALAPELMKFSGTPVPDYGEVSAGVLNSSESDNPQEKRIKSRNAMLPVDLVLGDLFLETHQYEQAARYYFNFLRANEWVASQAFISLMDSYFLRIFDDKIPSSFSMTVSNGYEWSSIFNVSADNDDIISVIPMAANKLRGAVTELPRYFGYDFYSTTGGSASSNERYLLERQIDASASYVALSDAQLYYYTPAGTSGGSTVVRSADLGDLRRLVTMRQVAKNDSAFAVMIKFTSAPSPFSRMASTTTCSPTRLWATAPTSRLATTCSRRPSRCCAPPFPSSPPRTCSASRTTGASTAVAATTPVELSRPISTTRRWARSSPCSTRRPTPRPTPSMPWRTSSATRWPWSWPSRATASATSPE